MTCLPLEQVDVQSLSLLLLGFTITFASDSVCWTLNSKLNEIGYSKSKLI